MLGFEPMPSLLKISGGLQVTFLKILCVQYVCSLHLCSLYFFKSRCAVNLTPEGHFRHVVVYYHGYCTHTPQKDNPQCYIYNSSRWVVVESMCLSCNFWKMNFLLAGRHQIFVVIIIWCEMEINWIWYVFLPFIVSIP